MTDENPADTSDRIDTAADPAGKRHVAAEPDERWPVR